MKKEITENPRAEKTLYINVDRRIFRNYFDRAGLYVVAGRPGTGRTSLVKQITEELAIDGSTEKNIYISTNPDSDEECSKFTNGKNIRAFSADDMNSSQLIISLDMEKSMSGLASVAIDDIGNLIHNETFRLHKKRNSEIMGYVLIRLKDVAEIYNIPVIVVMDVKGKVDSKNNKRPKLGDIKYSKCVKSFADRVLLLYRDEFYNPDSEEKGLTYVSMYDLNIKQKEVLPLTFIDGKYHRLEV